MRLTVDLVQRAPVRINPAKEMEISFRGFKIPAIENVGATQDQYDTIDLSDNAVKVLENFPIMNRLSTLALCNNRVTTIASGLGGSLVALEALNLTRNQIKELSDIDPLAEITSLRRLFLLDNPICRKPRYRLYVIARIPQINVLDFRKIKIQERKEAAAAFPDLAPVIKKAPSATTASVLDTEEKSKTFEVGNASASVFRTPEEIQRAKEAISRATSLEEMVQLERSLQGGVIPPPIPGRS